MITKYAAPAVHGLVMYWQTMRYQLHAPMSGGVMEPQVNALIVEGKWEYIREILARKLPVIKWIQQIPTLYAVVMASA